MMWTEKYRARQFKDLIGDERTHRSVLRWLRGWDPIVFPSLARQKSKKTKEADAEERPHRKVLLLTGPPGLGKTTLAHVCAKQAGYEVLEINASDERSRDVVKGRIRDAVGTENVRGMTVEIGGKKVRKSGKPVCVVVDEVDGVVSGSSGGEGGFMKALVDLLLLDQKNSDNPTSSGFASTKKTKKGDKFRLLRPLILICNDVYHPSLRPLRTSFLAEIIHVRQVSLEQVVARVRGVFQKEGIQCDGDGVRRLCESSWGLNTGRERNVFTRGVSQGDIRGIMVAAEWIGHQLLRPGQEQSAKLTKRWMEQRILDGSLGSGSSNGLGRGGTKEIVERVFLDGAGFPYIHGSMSARDPHSDSNGAKPVGVADLRKRYAIDRLREMVDASAEYDRCVTDCFLTYPTQSYQDDTFFSKPNAAYDWLHFHDSISSRVYSHQDWELTPYLSQSVVAFHQLFAATNPSRLGKKDLETEDEEEEDHPFSGPRADFAAFEAAKQNRSIITEFRATLSAPLLRTFRSLDTIATELMPNLLRMVTPDVKPVVVGGGYGSVATVRKEAERKLVKAAVGVMNGVGIKFEKVRVEMKTGSHGGFVFRMEP
jgi:chromosome transmission fidelity protein 18